MICMYNFLHAPRDMRSKNVEALRVLLGLCDTKIYALQDSWHLMGFFLFLKQSSSLRIPFFSLQWRLIQVKRPIIDFGSAMDDYIMKHLYGSVGPSRPAKTRFYAISAEYPELNNKIKTLVLPLLCR